MTSQLRHKAAFAAALLCALYCTVFVAGSLGAGGNKPGDGSAAGPQSISAAVADQKVDAAVAATVGGGEAARVLVTVRNADAIPVAGEQASAASLEADADTYDRRKERVLEAVGTGAVELREFQILPVMLMRIDDAAALADLATLPGVVSVEPDRRNRTDLAQSLPLIRQPQAQAAGHTGAGTAVAIIDTGVDFHRAAFGSCAHAGDPGCAVVYAQDFGGDDGSVDDNGHGTNVAGIALGVAPATKIVGLDVFQGQSAFDADILAGIEWTIQHQATYNIRALNLSLGDGGHNTSSCDSSSYRAPFALARSVGILPVVATGNFAYVDDEYEDGVASPACAPGAVRVGAVYDSNLGARGWGGAPYTCEDGSTAADKITCFSQSGQLLSLLAPGSEITAAGITESGTSQATPHVTGAAAVLAAVRPGASSAKVESSLELAGPTITDQRSGITRHRLDLPDAVENVQRQDAVVESGGCQQQVLPANDDGSTAAVQLPFTVNFFGSQYAETYVNNNGNITFETPLGTFTPFTITADVPPMIAPFFADVDTRGVGSRLVTYGATTFGGRPAFCVDWVDVGYFADHTDKTNSFQLLLVDRSNVGAGDFDVVMNYDRANWETGDASSGVDGFGGVPAAAGYSAGDGSAEHFFAFPGSLTSGAFLDNSSGGLVHGSRGSQQAGRYTFPIRNGLAPGNAGIAGTVTGPGAVTLAQAPVQACSQAGQCVTTRTGDDGHYQLSALPAGDYQVMAFPPSGSSLLPAGPEPAQLADGVVVNLDLELGSPAGPPPGTTITDHGSGEGGVPILNWNDQLTLATQACSGGSVSYAIRLGSTVIRSGPMTETPPGSGHYQASIAALYPSHGAAVISITSDCPNPGDDGQVDFDAYIDPSGTVVDAQGKPLGGSTVTLLRSDSPDGPFEVVADGDSVMSPSNRDNPDTTGGDGGFGWDVIAGYYEVRAAHAGCVSPGAPGVPYAQSPVLTIPPAVAGLAITLDCSDRVSVSMSGDGAVVSNPAGIACPPTCAHDFANGAAVELSAVAAGGSRFDGWSGACAGVGICRLGLAGDAAVGAAFTSGQAGGGGTTVTQLPAPKQLRCKKGKKRKKVHGRFVCVKKTKKHHRK